MPIDVFQNYVVFLSGTNLITSITSDITATTDVGAITANQILPAGTPIQNLFESLLVKIYYPTLNNPSASLSISNPTPSSNRLEVGTKGLTFNINFNAGSIIGKSVNGVWQPATSQDNTRTGAATAFYINNIYYPPTNPILISDAEIGTGTNTFTCAVSYLSGDTQPLDSINRPFSTIIPSGSAGGSLTITGVRKAFYGLNNVADNNETIRNAQNSLFAPAAGTTFTITATAGSTSVFFAYPSSIREVTSVIESVFGFNIKEDFSQTFVSVSGANGFSPVGYRVYRFEPVEPYPSPVTYTINI
jgi:hypothetical protein